MEGAVRVTSLHFSHHARGNGQRPVCLATPMEGVRMLDLKGKTAFVFGVASEDSIAWAICQQLAAAGCTLYLGYQKRFMSRIFKLKDQLMKRLINFIR